jgi:hypothetical protein
MLTDVKYAMTQLAFARKCIAVHQAGSALDAMRRCQDALERLQEAAEQLEPIEHDGELEVAGIWEVKMEDVF